MNAFSSADWDRIDRMRSTFLGLNPGVSPRRCPPYWRDRRDLELYDSTFGERIGWKWDAVLDELMRGGWTPPDGPVLDWGCGSGVAIRRVLQRFGDRIKGHVVIHDHSRHAMEFTRERIETGSPAFRVDNWREESPAAKEPVGLLLLSHVGNELGRAEEKVIEQLASVSQAVIWVEPGTHAESRRLGSWRERFRETFRVVAPCPHGKGCGILIPENARHWCHFFARTPSWVHQDRDWARFSKIAGIDLRSLPYCFVALDRRGVAGSTPPSGGAADHKWLGRPRYFKAYARVFTCRPDGVREEEISKRLDPGTWGRLEDFAEGSRD